MLSYIHCGNAGKTTQKHNLLQKLSFPGKKKRNIENDESCIVGQTLSIT